jgi:hypothetical protein
VALEPAIEQNRPIVGGIRLRALAVGAIFLAWGGNAVGPTAVFLGSREAPTICRMSCSGTAHCCCHPKKRAPRETAPGLVLLAAASGCPADCAVAPGHAGSRHSLSAQARGVCATDAAAGAFAVPVGAPYAGAIRSAFPPRGPPVRST